MRDQQAPDKFNDYELSCTSNFWKDNTLASETFITPTVTTGQGTSQLIRICTQGFAEYKTQALLLNEQAKKALHDQQYVYFGCTFELNKLRKEQGADFNEAAYDRAVRKKLTPYEHQKIRYDNAVKTAEELPGKFEQLIKIAQNLLATQQELGEEIKTKEAGVKKLTVAIKCIDAIWAGIVAMCGKLKALKEEIAMTAMSMAPVQGRMKELEVSAGPDGRQKIWIYDPEDVTPGDKIVLDPIEGEEEEAVAAVGAPGEGTVVDG